MTWQIAKVIISGIIISFSAWFAGRNPKLAGFLMALPISSMIALALNHTEYQDSTKSVAFAKSIFAAIPLSLLFFVPFLLADKLRWSFWPLFLAGVFLLAVGYAIHSVLVR